MTNNRNQSRCFAAQLLNALYVIYG